MKRVCMAETFGTPSGDLATHGIKGEGKIHWNLSATELIDLAVERNEGVFSAHKALVTETGVVGSGLQGVYPPSIFSN